MKFSYIFLGLSIIFLMIIIFTGIQSLVLKVRRRKKKQALNAFDPDGEVITDQ